MVSSFLAVWPREAATATPPKEVAGTPVTEGPVMGMAAPGADPEGPHQEDSAGPTKKASAMAAKREAFSFMAITLQRGQSDRFHMGIGCSNAGPPIN